MPPSPIPPPAWRDRLDDPAEPLYTVAVVADLLGVSPQTLRRIGTAADQAHRRPSGNQRRYSRNEIEILARALQLADEGHNGAGIARILDLEQRVAGLTTKA